MAGPSESQPLIGTLNKRVGNKKVSKGNESWFEHNKYATVYGIVSILLVLLFLIYNDGKAVTNSVSLNVESECPAICGVGYKSTEEITRLTSFKARRMFDFDESVSYSAKYISENNKNTIEVARIVPRNNEYDLVSQKLTRCEIEIECNRDSIDFVDNSYISSKWQYIKESNLLDPITMKFAIKQANSDYQTLESELLKVSDPESEHYGQYWSFDEIDNFFSPSKESHNAIKTWLKSFGILDNDINYVTSNGDFIQVEMSIQQANDLLSTEFGIWKHQDTGKTHIRVKDGYSVPSHVSKHLDFISPTLRFPVSHHITSMIPLPETAGWITDLDGKNEQLVDLSNYFEIDESDISNVNNNYYLKKDSVKRVIIRKKDNEESSNNNKPLSNSNSELIYNTPARLLQLYSMHKQNSQSNDNSQAIVSFLEEWYNMNDIESFGEYFDIPEPQITNIPNDQPSGYGTEAILDLEYIIATGRNVHTYVFDVEDNTYFLSLLKQLKEHAAKPLIVSMSYGGDEHSNGEAYCTRANVEFAKVGLLGITFFASAGDNGACGTSNACGLAGEYLPSFPASSPFVTSIGGTFGGTVVRDSSMESNDEMYNDEMYNDEMYNDETKVSKRRLLDSNEFTSDTYKMYCDRGTNEVAWYNSGGGFSKWFARPSWQNDAVSDYFNSYSILNDEDSKLESYRFNENGRAYPDLSAQSVNYVICDESLYWLVSGTSAAAPSIAGMFAMINDNRLRKNMPSLGFLNPYLYKLYSTNMRKVSKKEFLSFVKNVEIETDSLDNSDIVEKQKHDQSSNTIDNNNNNNEIDGESSKKTLVGDKGDLDDLLDIIDETDESDKTVYQVSRNIYFNDVVSGYNQGCGSKRKAFSAITGFDPVTGLGTIKFGKLLEALTRSDEN